MSIPIDLRAARARRPKNAVHTHYRMAYSCPHCHSEVTIETDRLKGYRTGVPCGKCAGTFTAEWNFTDVSQN